MSPKISVIGVGGAGGNAINNMIEKHLEGVEFIAANTDSQALSHSLSQNKIQLGQELTRGLGAGAKPEVGRDAALESIDEITNLIKDSNMVFITSGQGGGTGTGASPVLAKACKDLGILTVAVVTKPFDFEGKRRADAAKEGIENLIDNVDTMLVIPNQQLMKVAKKNTTFEKAFELADDILYQSVRGLTDLVVTPGLINLDFADLSLVMKSGGPSLMGTGEASGEGRALAAATKAMNNPLLGTISVSNASGAIISISGGSDIELSEIEECVELIRSEMSETADEAHIIFGTTFNEELSGKIRVSVIICGADGVVDTHDPIYPNPTQSQVQNRQFQTQSKQPHSFGGSSSAPSFNNSKSIPELSTSNTVHVSVPGAKSPQIEKKKTLMQKLFGAW